MYATRLLLAILLTLFMAVAPVCAQFSGAITAGSSTVTDNSGTIIITGQLTSAQIKAVSTPITLIAAPGANSQIQLIASQFTYNYGTTQYATGTQALVLRYAAAATTIANIINSADLKGAVNVYTVGRPNIASNVADLTNSAVTVNLASGSTDYTAGDGTISYEIIYRVASTNH